MSRKKDKDRKPKVHHELEGFDVEVNSFGEVKLNYDIDKLNQFLTRHVPDKKFKDRDDIEGALTYKSRSQILEEEEAEMMRNLAEKATPKPKGPKSDSMPGKDDDETHDPDLDLPSDLRNQEADR